jgi:methionyl-tRNA formyltransferase
MKLKKFQTVDILIDNPTSWMWDYISELKTIVSKYTNSIRIFQDKIEEGEILFILSCDKILKYEDLLKHKSNIVIHASDLPKNRGWSPWIWEVERGAKEIHLTLFEADIDVDSGKYYIKDKVLLDGYELIDELRKKIALKAMFMMENYLIKYPMNGKEQVGIETYNPKRNNKNQELDINKTIIEQFNKLRVCDNSRYPAHFYVDGIKYVLRIEKE